MHELNQHKIAALLPQRRAQSNKGSYGSVAAAAGSLAYRGAAALCVEGALRTGAGLVYLASVEPVIQLVLTRTPECCALPCRTDADGGILAADAAAVRQRFTEKPAVLLAGPGLGPSAARTLNALLTADAKWKAAVLDADALNALAAGELGQFPLLPTDTVLTPHPGEAARLLGCSVAQIQTDRPAAAQELAERYGCVAVLKGSGTLIAAPDGEELCAQYLASGLTLRAVVPLDSQQLLVFAAHTPVGRGSTVRRVHLQDPALPRLLERGGAVADFGWDKQGLVLSVRRME